MKIKVTKPQDLRINGEMPKVLANKIRVSNKIVEKFSNEALAKLKKKASNEPA